MHARRPLAALVATLLAAGLSVSAAAPDPTGGTGGVPLAGSVSVTVVAADSGLPLAGAWVMVGPAADDPFTGNVATTDAAGTVTFNDPALTGTITVTAGDTAHAYTTLFGLPSSELVLPLSPLAAAPTARIGDAFDGIEVANGFLCFGDGNLDFGLVLPAIPIDSALSSGVSLEISADSVPVSTPAGVVDVPSNVALPTQCELFTTFEKPGYELDVPLGRTTTFGLTARAPLNAFLEATNLVDLVRAASFREIDVIRDVPIVADRDDIDLFAATPVNANLTVNIANARPNTSVFAVAGGRLTANDGAQELVISGVDAFDPDIDGPSVSLTLETLAAGGTLSDLVPGAIVTQLRDAPDSGAAPDAFAAPETSASSTALVRDGFTPPASLTFDSFFEFPEIDSADDLSFSWSDVRSATSPGVRHLNSGNLTYQRRVPDPADPAATLVETTTYWRLWTPGASGALTLPTLPAGAPLALPDPSSTSEQDRLDLSIAVQFLGDATTFDYGEFALADIGRFGTHVSTNERPLRCDTSSEIETLFVEPGIVAGELTLSWSPSGDICHDTLSDRRYEVFAADEARPLVAPGAFPTDPGFVRITDQDSDGSLADTTFSHAVPAGSTYYLVVDRGSSGNDGPSGHYPGP